MLTVKAVPRTGIRLGVTIIVAVAITVTLMYQQHL
jgi:hypothetical protein